MSLVFRPRRRHLIATQPDLFFMTVMMSFRTRIVAATVAFSTGLIVGLGGSLAQDASPEPADDTVLATVDGEAITERDLAAAITEFRDIVLQMTQYGADVRSELLRLLIELKVASNAAVANGLDDDPAVTARLGLARERVLFSTYLNNRINSAVTDEAVRARFDEEVASFVPGDQVHALHILVETEDEAKEIIGELEQGGDFAAIAMEKSIDPMTGPRGGDLAYINRGDTVEPFDNAAFALGVDEYTHEPVQSEFGWHVIKVVDKRFQPAPTFEAEASRIRSDMMSSAREEVMGGLLSGANIDVVDDALPEDLVVEPAPNP